MTSIARFLASILVLGLGLFCVSGSCGDDDDSEDHAGDGDDNTDDDADDNMDDDADGDADDDGASDCRVLSTTVNPAPPDNPLAREILVTTAGPCSLMGYVTTNGEPGRGLSFPRATDRGVKHSLWFYGLIEGKAFQYFISSTEDEDLPVSQGSFSAPLLPSGSFRFAWVKNSADAEQDSWLAVTMIDFRISGLSLRQVNLILVFDRGGRCRFYHETPVPDIVDPALYTPIAGLQALPNHEILFTNQEDLMGVSPNGAEYRFIDLHIDPPYQELAHHQFSFDPQEPDHAFILINHLGPGLKCDLETPTNQALGDAVLKVDRSGREIWRWDVFDHQDAVPPEEMNACLCREFEFGRDKADWTHANQVFKIPDQHALIVSMRNMNRIVKIDLNTGDVIWSMGRGLDFEWIGEEPAAERWFLHQHDPSWLAGDRILLFDNGNGRSERGCHAGPWSRGLELQVDDVYMTVRKIWEHRVPYTSYRGTVQRSENGATLISNNWGGFNVEVMPDGREIWSGQFPFMSVESCIRYYKALWEY